MAQSFLTGINLNGNQLTGLRLENLGTAPTANVVTGRLYFNTGDKLPYWYDGSSWITFATSGDYTSLSSKVTVLEGYFTSGKANNADKLDGHDTSYFATATGLTSANANITTLQGYFTSGIANQAAKVTNALSFTAGAFSDPGDYNGSAAMTLKVPTTTAHITEDSNLYFTVARAQAAITGGASTIVTSDLTASRALVSDTDGKVAVSVVTSTELSYLNGVTSAIQTQLNTLDGKFADYLPLAGGIMASGATISWGTTTEYIKGTSTDGNVAINATNAISLSINKANEVTLTGAALYPTTSGGNALGTSSNKWSALYLSGAAGIGGNVSVDGTLSVTGNSTFTGNTTNKGVAYFAGGTTYYVNKSGDAKFNTLTAASTLTVGGLATFNNGAKIASGKTLQIGNVVLEETNGVLALYYVSDKEGTTNTASFYATGGVSALGYGEGGSSGGGLIETVYTWSDLTDDKIPAAEDTTTTVTAMASYQIYQYALTAIANAENANNVASSVGTSLLSLTSRVNSLEALLGDEGTIDGAIDKFYEITAFLDGIEGTTLNDLFGQYTTTANTRSLVIQVGGTTKQTYSPTATANSTLNFAAGTNISLSHSGSTITIDNTYSYTLPLATSSARGGIKVGYTATSTSGTVYNAPVALSSEKAYVAITKTAITTALGYTPLESETTYTGYDLVIENSEKTTELTYKPLTNGTYSLTLTKSMVGLGNVENTALSTWAGSSKITTVGTISTGTWDGSTISVSKGGTGATTLTSGAALIGNGTGAVSFKDITDNTSATAVTASANLITANTLYYHKGNSNIVTVGTITSGTWEGSKIANTYLANSSISIAGTSVSLGGSITAATLQGKLDAVRKYTTTITGTGSATSFTVTHSLGTQALATLVFDSNYKQVFCDVTHTDTSNVTLGFGTAPSTSTTYTVVILA